MALQKNMLRLAAFGFLIAYPYPGWSQNACIDQALKTHPKWISTLELNAQAGEILIADPKDKQLLSFNLRNGNIEAVKLPEDLKPTTIAKVDGGFLIKSRDDATIIGPTREVIGKKFSIRSAQSKRGGEFDLVSLYSNWVTKGSTFLGFGAISTPTQGFDPERLFQLGVIKGEISAESGGFRNIQRVDMTDKNDYYLLGLPYFAATNTGLFYVRMVEPQVSLVRVREFADGKASPVDLTAFPKDKDFRSLPQLGSADLVPVAQIFKRMEEIKMVAGLFGQGGLLYLLTREPVREPSGAGTKWLLHQINPKTNQLVDSVRLPTRAPHLSVAVGTQYWYLFERGHVKEWGVQDIDRVVWVPTHWITDVADSRLNVHEFLDHSDVKCLKR